MDHDPRPELAARQAGEQRVADALATAEVVRDSLTGDGHVVVGAANVTWCAVRHMTASGQRGGRIVNVGSRGAFRGEPTHPAYGASKAGLHAFGHSLAVALAPHGITVASVAPGYVAAAVVYLASPEAEWASGAVLDLNGASYLR
jgi:3-oxoacyl-[acyl-carrier protein] reductase